VLRIESHHVGLARAISDVARKHRAVAARPDELDVGFWRAVLGYATLADDNGADPLGHGSTFWMQDLDPAKPLRHAMHVDVSVAREPAEARVRTALAVGGRVVDESSAPGAWILADPAGNRVCVAAWPDGATQ
jgi:4a-hydroxytetrahydrobiopterin dehydratase